MGPKKKEHKKTEDKKTGFTTTLDPPVASDDLSSGSDLSSNSSDEPSPQLSYDTLLKELVKAETYIRKLEEEKVKLREALRDEREWCMKRLKQLVDRELTTEELKRELEARIKNG